MNFLFVKQKNTWQSGLQRFGINIVELTQLAFLYFCLAVFPRHGTKCNNYMYMYQSVVIAVSELWYIINTSLQVYNIVALKQAGDFFHFSDPSQAFHKFDLAHNKIDQPIEQSD